MLKTLRKNKVIDLLFWAGDYPAIDWIWFVLFFLVIVTAFVIVFGK